MTLRADHVAGIFFIAARHPRLRAERRPAVRHHLVARRRHDAEADGRPDDGVCRGDHRRRPARSQPLAEIDWSDRWHALLVVLITAAGIYAYQRLGFLVTMSLLVFTLLVVVERRNVLIAAAYSIGLTLFAYWLFGKALKAPLERGLLWF